MQTAFKPHFLLKFKVFHKFQGDNSQTNDLLNRLNADNRIHLVAGKVNETFFLRLAVCSQKTEESHIRFAYDVISELADSQKWLF